MDVNVLMIDDHPPIIEGYKSLLTFNPYGYSLNFKDVNNCEAAYNLIISTEMLFDVVFLDVTLPPFAAKNFNSGEDLIPLIRKHFPEAKIVVLTSHSESIILNSILNKHYPDGLLLKSEIHSDTFTTVFDAILKGTICYSPTVKNIKNDIKITPKLLDHYNRQIILLLSRGVKTKTIQEELHLSKSAIDKRKVIIKDYLGIIKGNDEDLLREARKQGLI